MNVMGPPFGSSVQVELMTKLEINTLRGLRRVAKMKILGFGGIM